LKFIPGKNIAIKIPPHEFDASVVFYRDIIGLKQIDDRSENVVFEFGDKRLWLDKVDHLSNAEIWLEIQTNDVDSAKNYLETCGVVFRDEIEKLPEGFTGF
jgi:predicted enzyme related to lactoylglutathione lyase